jgi:spermidine/putrescine transport system permease protein
MQMSVMVCGCGHSDRLLLCFRPSELDSHRNVMWLRSIALFVYLFLYAPILIVVLFSFDDSRLAVKWVGFTLKWYDQLFHDEILLRAFTNSMIVASVSVVISTTMATMAAVGMSRFRFAGKDAFRALTMLPVIVPEIAMAVSALTLFVALGVRLSLGTIIVAHVVFCVAYITLVVMGRLQGLDPRLEEAAQDLGAPPVVAFFKVTLPLLMPGIVSGALLAFVLSLDDFVITQFTAGVGDTTLPLWIYSSVKFGVSPEINALSTLMIAVTAGATIVAEIVRRRK